MESWTFLKKHYHIGQSFFHIHEVGGDLMIIIPADRLAAAVQKHLLPGLIRSIIQEQKNGVSMPKVSGEK